MVKRTSMPEFWIKVVAEYPEIARSFLALYIYFSCVSCVEVLFRPECEAITHVMMLEPCYKDAANKVAYIVDLHLFSNLENTRRLRDLHCIFPIINNLKPINSF